MGDTKEIRFRKMNARDLIQNVEKMDKISIINVLQDNTFFGNFYVHIKYSDRYDIYFINDRNIYEINVCLKKGLRKVNIPFSFIVSYFYEGNEYIPFWESIKDMWEFFESNYLFLNQITKTKMKVVVSKWKKFEKKRVKKNS